MSLGSLLGVSSDKYFSSWNVERDWRRRGSEEVDQEKAYIIFNLVSSNSPRFSQAATVLRRTTNRNASPMPAMVRKAHYKSRNGCIACKKRHVKCSETRPRCAHCTRLDIECNWPEGSRSDGASQSQLHSPAANVPPFSVPSPGSSLVVSANGASRQPQPQPELSIDDLKLLHFYFVNTSISMTLAESPYMWQNVVVELGFRHHFLLHGILAVAATHKASIYSSESEELLVQSAAHVEIGLRDFRKCLEFPLPATCVPVFLMAGVLAVQSLGTAQVHPPIDPVGDLCMWMRMVRGTKSTIQQNWAIIQSSEIAMMLQGHERHPDDNAQVAEIDNLRSLVEQSAAAGPTDRVIYLDCVEQLRSVFVNARRLDIAGKQSSAMSSSWVATIHEGYRELLDRREPLALVIIAYFATLFRTSPNIWWYRNWDSWILNAVHLELPQEYQPWLEWPRMQLGLANSMTSTPTAMTV